MSSRRGRQDLSFSPVPQKCRLLPTSCNRLDLLLLPRGMTRQLVRGECHEKQLLSSSAGWLQPHSKTTALVLPRIRFPFFTPRGSHQATGSPSIHLHFIRSFHAPGHKRTSHFLPLSSHFTLQMGYTNLYGGAAAREEGWEEAGRARLTRQSSI